MKDRSDIQVKVCGLKDPANVREIAAAGPGFMGFIFYPKSPRYMMETLTPVVLKDIPSGIRKVGVFVNEELERVLDLARMYRLDLLQLHGNESPEYCVECRKHYPVIKAFGMSDNFDFTLLDQYKNCVDFFLFDTKTDKHGGSGEKFDWTLLKNYCLEIPYFLSGGIGEEDIDDLLLADIPQGFILDVNSKIEIRPGLKDVKKASLIINKLAKCKATQQR